MQGTAMKGAASSKQTAVLINRFVLRCRSLQDKSCHWMCG